MARKFAKIKPHVWRYESIREVDSLSKLVALYTMTNEYFQMLGIYRLPIPIISNDLKITDTQARNAIENLIKSQFCKYCFESDVIWVIDMAVTQVADNPNTKQLTGVNNELLRLYEEKFPFIGEFLEKYSAKYLLPESIEEILDMKYIPTN